ncbi:MAG: aminotransferase class V-fold PLP-dependent enzyme [Saprospiraceae bacterium]|jgi:selenocysteine lyase/cysteine desulfurase|nr:aminotransferase class V-fold PLP-dependent enzyme [Saprospiraceae bacterium]MBP6565790.1 aminotransferase class V-fold PLP-dependent enzyme [Saprospiraceae bacterium]
MNQRRSFFRQAGMLAGAFSTQSIFSQWHASELSALNRSRQDLTPEELATDEDYWSVIQQAYTVNPAIINLNNGGVSPSPRIVQEAVERYNKLANEGPSYFMWRILDQGREPLRQKLADLAGCEPEEIAVNRNSTEALNTVIFGMDLKAGDEVIGTKQDYPNMINAWRQRVQREGITYTQISFDFPIEDDNEIVSAFEKAITPKTKVLHITHVINWMGQILPVKKLCDMATKRGLKTIVDGAHSFGLIDFRIPDLGCDYFGASLHKFLSAPIGSGMLWIRKDNIKDIWPLVCNDNPKSGDIRKFETLGTRSFPIEQGIGEAINFHQAIGSKRKEARIRYLKNYWAKAVKDIPKVKIHTSLKDDYSCAICGVSVAGMTMGELENELFSKYKIHVVSIDWENIHCVRVTPHVYTRLKDLDKLINALKEISAKK